MLPMPLMGSMGAPGSGTAGGLGPELVVNGDFSSGTGWTLAGTAVISGTSLDVTAGGSGLVQATNTGALQAGKRYRISFEVSAYVGGGVSAGGVTGGAGAVRLSAGTFSEDLTAGASAQIAVFARGTNFTGSVKALSVREIL